MVSQRPAWPKTRILKRLRIVPVAGCCSSSRSGRSDIPSVPDGRAGSDLGQPCKWCLLWYYYGTSSGAFYTCRDRGHFFCALSGCRSSPRSGRRNGTDQRQRRVRTLTRVAANPKRHFWDAYASQQHRRRVVDWCRVDGRACGAQLTNLSEVSTTTTTGGLPPRCWPA